MGRSIVTASCAMYAGWHGDHNHRSEAPMMESKKQVLMELTTDQLEAGLRGIHHGRLAAVVMVTVPTCVHGARCCNDTSTNGAPCPFY